MRRSDDLSKNYHGSTNAIHIAGFGHPPPLFKSTRTSEPNARFIMFKADADDAID
jgi:hypothetical protein